MSRDYVAHTKHLLPPGKAYPRIDVGWLHKLVTGFVAGFERVDALAVDLRDEYFPPTATQLLADFERVFGLPDDCAPADTLEERRAAVQARLLAQGGGADGVGVQFLTALAESIGYSDVTIERRLRRAYSCESSCEAPRDAERALLYWHVTAQHQADALDARLRCEFERVAISELTFSFPLLRFGDATYTRAAGATGVHPITGAQATLAADEMALHTLIVPRPVLGHRWRHRDSAAGYSASLLDVAWGAGVLIAVGSAGELQRSTDGGRSWVRQTAADGYTGGWAGVTWSGSRFVVVGSGGEIQTSQDGLAWAVRAADSYTTTFAGVYRVGAMVVAVGKSAGIQTSADGGLTWTRRTPATGFTGYFYAVTGTEDVLVVAGAGGELQTSADGGLTWTRRSSAGGYTGAWSAATAMGDALIVAGDAGQAQVSNDSGESWERLPVAGGYQGAFRGAVVADWMVVLLGEGGEIQTSRDLVAWQRREPANLYGGTLYGAAWDGTVLAAVGATAEIQTSEIEAAT